MTFPINFNKSHSSTELQTNERTLEKSRSAPVLQSKDQIKNIFFIKDLSVYLNFFNEILLKKTKDTKNLSDFLDFLHPLLKKIENNPTKINHSNIIKLEKFLESIKSDKSFPEDFLKNFYNSLNLKLSALKIKLTVKVF